MDSWIKEAAVEIHRRNAEGVLASQEIAEVIAQHETEVSDGMRAIFSMIEMNTANYEKMNFNLCRVALQRINKMAIAIKAIKG